MQVKNKAAVNAPWLYLYVQPHCVKAIGVPLHQWQLWAQSGCWYIHIAWGFLSLFVSFAQAISQEPQTMKRATVQGFTLSFCLYITLVEPAVAVVLGRRKSAIKRVTHNQLSLCL